MTSVTNCWLDCVNCIKVLVMVGIMYLSWFYFSHFLRLIVCLKVLVMLGIMYLWKGIMTGWVSSWQCSRAGVWQPCVQSEASVQVTWLLLTNHSPVWPGQSLLRPWGQRPVAVHHDQLIPTIHTFYMLKNNQFRGHFWHLSFMAWL